MDLNQVLAAVAGLTAQKPPKLVTDRYIREKYDDRDVFTEDPGSKRVEPTIINLRDRGLREIPAWVFNIRNLEGLLLDRNPDLHALPGRMAKLEDLRVLGLQRTPLESYDPVACLHKLESLDISGNKITGWPESISTLESVLYLDISSYNTIPTIPDSIGSLTKLRVLRAHYNETKTVSDNIGNLHHLEQLILGGNALTSIPDSIYSLSKLIELDLYNNQIRSLDLRALSRLEHLDQIFLAGNPLQDFPAEYVAQSKGIISSLGLRRYFSTGVYLGISKGRANEDRQKARLVRSSRAMLIRGIFHLCRRETNQAKRLLRAAEELAHDLRHEKLKLLVAGFLEATAEPASQQARYGEELRLAIGRVFSLSEQPPAAPERDFEFVLNNIFLGDLDLIQVDETDSFVHTMLEVASPGSFAEMNNRDLMRGMIETGLFSDAWTEMARQHCTRGTVVEFEQLTPRSTDEAFICLMQLTNRDKLRILINQAGSGLHVIKLDSISLSLNKVTTAAMLQELQSLRGDPDPVSESISTLAWQSFFGAYIISVQSYHSVNSVQDLTLSPTTFHDYCQSHGISKLSIVPTGSTHGIPLYCSHSEASGEMSIDHYEMSYRPPFIPIIKPTLRPIEHDVVLATHSSLRFSRPEAELVSAQFERSFTITNEGVTETLDLFERARVIHFSCHAGQSRLRLGSEEAEITLQPDDIRSLNLSRCELVVLNACRTSEDPIRSHINIDSLILAFMEAGAHTAISTSLEVSDAEAFRIGVRFYQLWKGGSRPSDTFRELLLEAFRGDLPWFDGELMSSGHFELGAGLAAQREMADLIPRLGFRPFLERSAWLTREKKDHPAGFNRGAGA